MPFFPSRHSCRAYSPRPVEREKLMEVLDAARTAPSAVNFQPWTFVVVESEAARQAVQACYNREWFTSAPLYVVVTVNASVAWTRKSDGKNHADIDGAIAAEHLCLAAVEQGLATCWVCNFDALRLHEALGLAADEHAVAILPIGNPAGAPEKRTDRKAMDEVVRFI